jgi:hypothetical protein
MKLPESQLLDVRLKSLCVKLLQMQEENLQL